jgi:hypothetical protein
MNEQATEEKRWTRPLLAAALLLVLCGFTAGALHRVANVWQRGHGGHNGAGFSQAARNSLRFGVVAQAKYHTDLTPPPDDAFYVNRPLMLHLHLVMNYALFGFKEWAGRLVPVAYAVGSLLLLTLLVWRFGGAGWALVAAAIYALTPLNLIFADMIDHEQGCIFWCLALFYAFQRWRQTHAWRHLGLSLFFVTLAAQFDWPGYYIAFFVAVQALAGWLRSRRPSPREDSRRHLAFLSCFTVTVMVNFAGFFLWVHSLPGGISTVSAAFTARSHFSPGYLSQQWHRVLDLHGLVPVALVVAWCVVVLWRWRQRRETHALDRVCGAFLFAQMIHWWAFPNAAHFHSYWSYYLGPATAIGSARVLLLIWDWIGRRTAIRALCLAAAVTLGLWQGWFAWDRFHWGMRTGHASYVPDYHDQYDEITWAKAVGQLFPRPTASFIVDPSIRDRRIELDWYLDGPISAPANGGPQDVSPDPGRQRVLLVDLKHIQRSDQFVAWLQQVVRSRRTLLWDRRFLAVVLNRDGPFKAFARKSEAPSFWWRWLVNPDHPPARWVDDPVDRAHVMRLLVKQR